MTYNCPLEIEGGQRQVHEYKVLYPDTCPRHVGLKVKRC